MVWISHVDPRVKRTVQIGHYSQIGAALARLRSLGTAQAVSATAIAQPATSAIVFAGGEGRGATLIRVFVAMWLVSAQLFRKASQEEARAGDARIGPRPN